ncbi:MAG: zinc ribbon domain-containing protein [Leptospiraceae bacterium]|nr:zinc ribbon domain-containing protein [Leptospiraceae bacterium]
MPTYSYVCKECGHKFDHLQSIKDDRLTQCPDCQKDSLERLIGSGAGIVFKGSGFYVTDYKKSNAGESTPANATATPASSPKTDTAAPG